MKHLEFPDVEIHELKSEIIGETFEILAIFLRLMPSMPFSEKMIEQDH